MPPAATPLVFIHGLWLHADSWGPWIDLFREAGYAPTAPGWPGHGTIEETRSEPERVAGFGINDIVEHYARIINALDAKPIVIGHSFGGLVVQRLLGQDLAAAAVAIDPAPIKGIVYLPPSALRVASIALRNPANRKRAVTLTREQFRYGFGNAISAKESDELYERWTIPSPGKPLFEVAFANFSPGSPAKVNTDNATRGPLLLTAGGKDRTVPPHCQQIDPQAAQQVTRGDGLQGVPRPRPYSRARHRLAGGCLRRNELAQGALLLGNLWPSAVTP